MKSQDLLDDLSDDPKDRAVGERIVAEGKERGDLSPIITRPFTYSSSISDAPYSFNRTRFSDGTQFGVWYGSLDLLTTVYETVYHFKKRIEDIMIPIGEEVVSERRVFKVHVGCILVDLRGKQHQFPALLAPEDYSFTNSVGAYLYDNGQGGLIVDSARWSDGINMAAFRPNILSNPRHHSYLVYRWIPGGSSVRIEKTPGRTWKTIGV
ncbi:MAG: RES domain-containing protein [Nitrospirales bacterium]|nr:RES domain-containing protein [Nitrospirales bacterium]